MDYVVLGLHFSDQSSSDMRNSKKETQLRRNFKIFKELILQ